MKTQKTVSTKLLAAVMAVVLVFGCIVGGTVAWLTDYTDPVTNTFTVGNIDIELDETDNLNLKMVPGNTITKDPKVTVKANSEACWVFVKIDESTKLDTFITYDVDGEVWTQLKTDATGNAITDIVYYREQATSTADVSYSVLVNNQVTVKDTVTKDMMDDITDGTASAPTLTFTAYAIQQAQFETVEEAWTEVSKLVQ